MSPSHSRPDQASQHLYQELTLWTAERVVQHLSLQPHPEGGWYREIHRSGLAVQRADGLSRRAFTQILYLLPAGGISRWHRVRSAEETWLFMAGASLELWQLPPQGGEAACTALGLSLQHVAVVPPDWWQAARSVNGWSLVSCAVAPGFEFEDFELLSAWPSERRPVGACADWL